MPMRRRSLLILGGLAAPTILRPARAQSAIPDKAVRLLVGFGSGNGTDTVARELGPQLERRVGRHISVENRVGESGAAAGEALKNGPNDGSFLALLPSTTIAAAIGDKNYPFDALVDTAPISLLGRFPLAIAVSPRIGVETYEQYVAYVKSGDADRVQLGSTASSDAFSAVYGKMMSHALGAPMKIVGFRGGSAMVTDVEQGRVPACISNLPTLLAAHRGGRVKIVLLTGTKRSPAAPGLPTAADLNIPGLDLREWYMLFTGGRAPREAVVAWNGHVRALIDDVEFRGVLTQLGLDAEGTTPEEARATIVETLKLWRERMEGFGVLPAN
jgi:tripartite-type tricarboxylate transporter receptor subunit TctC